MDTDVGPADKQVLGRHGALAAHSPRRWRSDSQRSLFLPEDHLSDGTRKADSHAPSGFEDVN